MRDELAVVGEIVFGSELVWTTLNGVAKPWVVFVQLIFPSCLLERVD